MRFAALINSHNSWVDNHEFTDPNTEFIVEHQDLTTCNEALIHKHINWITCKFVQFNHTAFAELEHIIGEYYTIPPVSDSWQRSPYGKNLLHKFFVEFVDRSIEKKKAQMRMTV